MRSFLVFESDSVQYAVLTESVKNVFWMPELSAIEAAPPWFIGLMNWHGEIVHVLDLGLRFKHVSREYLGSTNIILVNTPQMRCGIVADYVKGLINVSDESVVERDLVIPPDFRSDYSKLISGEVKYGDEIILLLNLPALLTVEVGLELPANPEADIPKVPSQSAKRNEEVFRVRMHQLAMPIEDGQEVSKQAFALITIGGIKYAIEAQYILEFSHLKQCTPLPCCPPYILGAINLRGEILSVIDMTSLLRIQNMTDKRDVVILEFETKKMALAVERVENFRYFDRSLITELQDVEEHHAQCKALLRLDHGVAGILDIEAVLIGNLLEVDERI